MNKRESLARACAQLSLDYNAPQESFLADDLTLTRPAQNAGRRVYTHETPFFQMVTMGRGAVMMADERLHEALEAFAEGKTGHWLFEYANLNAIGALLRPYGYTLYGTFHMFLPGEPTKSPTLPNGFALRWFDAETVKAFYPTTSFANALSAEENPNRPDVIALGAYQSGACVALAGASADTDEMWQVGVDVLPAYRGLGLGAALVGRLRAQIEALRKLPFYGTSPSNLHSQSIALKCGFHPAWVEVSSRKTEDKGKE